MIGVRRLILLPAAALLLGGCVAGMVASAVGMAAGGRGGQGDARNRAYMQAAARQACSNHAAQYGAVQVTAVKQDKSEEIIVTGTITDAGGKHSFECSFVTEITGFAMHPIQPTN